MDGGGAEEEEEEEEEVEGGGWEEAGGGNLLSKSSIRVEISVNMCIIWSSLSLPLGLSVLGLLEGGGSIVLGSCDKTPRAPAEAPEELSPEIKELAAPAGLGELEVLGLEAAKELKRTSAAKAASPVVAATAAGVDEATAAEEAEEPEEGASGSVEGATAAAEEPAGRVGTAKPLVLTGVVNKGWSRGGRGEWYVGGLVFETVPVNGRGGVSGGMLPEDKGVDGVVVGRLVVVFSLVASTCG